VIENQALEEPGITRGKKDRAKGGRRDGKLTWLVHETIVKGLQQQGKVRKHHDQVKERRRR